MTNITVLSREPDTRGRWYCFVDGFYEWVAPQRILDEYANGATLNEKEEVTQ